MLPLTLLATALFALALIVAAWTIAARITQPLQNDRDEFADGLGFTSHKGAMQHDR